MKIKRFVLNGRKKPVKNLHMMYLLVLRIVIVRMELNEHKYFHIKINKNMLKSKDNIFIG